MPPGGARNRNGAITDPNSARSDKRGLRFRELDPRGYEGKAPGFPIPDDSGDEEIRTRELDLWWDAWRTPQACVWAEEPWRWRIIAQYCRLMTVVELSAEPNAALIGQLHRFRDQLGLTPAGMSENRWAIASSDDATSEASEKKAVKRKSSRDRLPVNVKVVEGGGA